jgi:transcriptional regulator with XRE-family HTH domain
MNTKLSSSLLWSKLDDRGYRRAFLIGQFKRMVPFQIQILRKQRGWSQEQLAEACDLTQGVISRAEDPDYGNLTINTILRIANGFDVAFIGRFAPYGDLEDWFGGLSEKMYVPSFDVENALRQGKVVAKAGPVSNRWNYENKPSSVPMNYGHGNVIALDKLGHGLQGKEQSRAA